MNKYEATFIFPSDVQVYEHTKAELKKEFENVNIRILKEEDKGDQQLAYPIRKNNRGRYLFLEIEAPPTAIKHLDKILRLKTGVIRHLFIRC